MQCASLDNVDFRSFTDSSNFDFTSSRQLKDFDFTQRTVESLFHATCKLNWKATCKNVPQNICLSRTWQNSSKLRMPICFLLGVSYSKFFQMLTLTLRVKSSQFCQSQGQGCSSKLGLALKVRVMEQGQGWHLQSGLAFVVRVMGRGQS